MPLRERNIIMSATPRTRLDIRQKCVTIMPTILGHGATAAHRTLNPLIQVRILVPRPSLIKTLINQENDTDRQLTSQALVHDKCHPRGFAFKPEIHQRMAVGGRELWKE